MKGLSLKSMLFFKILERTKGGTLEATLPDGRITQFGEGDPLIRVKVTEWNVLDELLTKGDIGLAENIISGRFQVDDVPKLVEWACRNSAAMTQFLHGTWYGILWARARHLFLNKNSKRGAKKNIMAHYDLGNDFYKLWLDPTMTYSSALYGETHEPLTEAQYAKYDRIIDALEITDKDHVLEIGCGWGGFFSRAVERTGCKVTAVMNSPAQAEFNRKNIAAKKMNAHVELKQQDYRDIQGKFDKIVSIEMIEAVGEQYWRSFFGKMADSLKPGGRSLIQSITIRDELFDEYRQQTDFIQQSVFPGGMLLANKIFQQYGKEFGLKVDTPFEFGMSYAQTLAEWTKNFHAKKSEVASLGFDEKFMRYWNLYLGYCEGAFRAGRVNVGHYLLEKSPSGS